MPVFTFTEGLQLAVSRRSGDEIHPWPPNGGLRPTAAIGPQTLQRLLSVKAAKPPGVDEREVAAPARAEELRAPILATRQG